MNKIKSYYWYVGVPIAVMVLGTVLFFDLIVQTIKGNPHPQINYVIFVLIVAGSIMMWQQVARMNKDAKRIESYYDVAVNNPGAEVLRAQLSGKPRDTDAVFEIITDLMGKPVSSVQHSALESELERYHSVQARYLILPQFMSGLMVGMGLLGTFIGLLGALSEISKLIGAFSVTNSGDPSEAIKMLVERLTSPMQAMGVAFSASLFGVLGSLVMGVLLVGVRNCAGELNSLLDSRVTYLTDFSNEVQEGGDTKGLGEAIHSLAEQSPILRSMVSALDQSEKRVRDLINSMVQIASRLEINQAGNTALVDALQSRLEIEDATVQSMQAQQASLAQIATRWSNATQIETQIAALVQQQTQQSERFMVQLEQSTEQHQALAERLVTALADGQAQQAASSQNIVALNKTMASFSEETAAKLGDVVGVQRRSSDQMAEILQNGFKDMAGVQRRGSDEFTEITQTGFRDLAGAQRRSADESNKELTAQLSRMTEVMSGGQAEQAALTQQISRITDVLANLTSSSQTGIQKVMDLHQRNFEKTVRDQAEAATTLANTLQGSQGTQMAAIKGLDHTLGELSKAFRTDAEARSLMVNRLELQLQDYSARQEQFAQSVAQSISVLAELSAQQPTQA